MYSMQLASYESDTYILKTSDEINSVLIIETGWVEIFTEFDGNEFIIERLTTGSVINHRNALNNDKMDVSIRCLTYCKIWELSMTALNQIRQNNKKVENKINKYVF